MAMTYESVLEQLAAERGDIVVMTAENRAAIRNLPPILGDRFIDVGICEQTMIGAAAGLALRGRRPIVHALASFLTMRAFEFIRTDIGIGRLPVKLVGGVPGILSEANGPTHQAIEDVALMRGIPNMGVFCPADADELADGLRDVIESDRPFYIRHNPTPAIVEHAPFVIGQAETFGAGTDVAILTYGFLVGEAIGAQALLEERGIATRVVSLRTLSPIDESALLRSVDECSLVVTLEDHFLIGGLHSILAETLLARHRTAHVLPIAFEGRWFRPALLADVLAYERLNAAALADRIAAAVPERATSSRDIGTRITASRITGRFEMANTVSFNENFPDITESDALYARALGLIPSVTQTLAKGPSQHVRGIAPKYLARGRGARVWDVDGNEYIDFTMGVGPLSLGYCHPVVDDAIRAQLGDGITFSLMHPLEVEVAELVAGIVPNAERVRFSKTGCDVTSAAVRLARAHTGRDTVLCCGYHGWHDWYIGTTDRNAGVPEATCNLTYTFSYNDFQSVLDAVDDDTACIILEPFVFEAPRENFLHRLRDLCDERGIVLVFDEMWTGFRVALGGAQEYFGVRADLACFSKAVANGMPLSILTGRAEVMDRLERDVFFYTTFGGEALSLAAAKATIGVLRDQNVPARLAQTGARLREGYNEIASELGIGYTRCSGFDCRTIVTFDAAAGDPLAMKSLVQQELIRRGVLWGGFHNMSFSHTDEEIEHTLTAYREVLPILAGAVADGDVAGRVRGGLLEPVFRRTGNFNTKPRPRAAVSGTAVAEK